MNINEVLEKLENDDIFKLWRETNKEDILAHLFVMCEKENSYQVGFYNKNDDKISTFIVEDKVQLIPEQTIFKHEGAVIYELNPEEIKLDFEQALEKAEEVRKENYPNYNPMKKFFILQKLKDKIVYNMTLVSQTLEVLNIKINAIDGSVVDQGMHNLMGDMQ